MWLPLLIVPLLLCSPPHAAPLKADEPVWPRADPNYTISFPRDEGSHPEFAGEWWYITGWLDTPEKQPLGFQVTFFRFRKRQEANAAEGQPLAQILVGHAA